MKILTIAFNGYGRFFPALYSSIQKQTIKPDGIILVLGKNHGFTGEYKDVEIIETDLDCMGSLINEGMKLVDDWVLYFSIDDILLPNAIEEIKKVDADVITLKYYHNRKNITKIRSPKVLCDTPKIKIENLPSWNKYYIGASGYFAFKKQQVINSDFWKYPLLFKAVSNGQTIKSTQNVCAEWIQRRESHGSGKNISKALEVIKKYAEKYSANPKLSVFSVVYNEESMCEEAWESVKGVDELIICIDDRTTDKTPEIAKKFTDKIYYFKWEDDFAKAKNFAMSKCTGDWVFGIDGDCALKTPIDKIRHAIKETDCDMIDMTLYPIGRDWMKHVLPKVFRNGKIKYEGMAHEYPVGGKRDFKDYGIELEYDYSPSHAKDPDRYIRILTKATEKEPNNTRWKYYLAREYYYKKDHEAAIKIYKDYIKDSTFMAEKADAYLHLGRCYWAISKGDNARENTLKAIEINPNFKEALLFMSEIVWERHSQRWLDFAEKADNSEVLFIR